MAGNTSRPGASVISRALALLNAFDEQHRVLSLAELATRAELPMATAYRQVNELVSGGALVRGDHGNYVIGKLMWRLGLLAPVQTGLRRIASPFLHDIYAATQATVHLAVREDNEALYLDRLSGHTSVPVVSTVGSKLPLHATGVGKVLLAYAPAEVREQVLSSLTRITPFTITQPKQMSDQLARIRRDHYATTIEEMTLGACSIAVPVVRGSRTTDQDVVAAIGVVLPNLKRDRARLTTALQVAAQGISRSLASA